MSYSVAQICNLALSYCGVSQTIATISDTSTEGKVCNLHYAPTRDALLEAFAWPFATKYVALALVQEFEDGDNEASDWGMSYRVPVDCLSVRRIVTGTGIAEPTPVPFGLGSDSSGPLLFTSVEDPVIEYTSRFEDPQFFSPTFAKALAWSLAAEIAFPLSVSEPKRQVAVQMAAITLGQARASSLATTRPTAAPDSSFIQARA